MDVNLSVADSVLYSFIANGAKVLFVRPRSYRGLQYLVAQKNVDLTILDNVVTRQSYVEDFGASFLIGDIYNVGPAIPSKEFDILIMDDILLSYTDVQLALDYATRIARYCLITFPNPSTLKNRLRFLFTGTVFSRFESEKWYEREILYNCSLKEFIELCIDSNISIERSCYYDAKMERRDVFDIKRFPSLTAEKFYFILSKFE